MIKYRAFLIGVVFALGTNMIEAQTPYPSQPITLVVPFSAGSGADLSARLLSKRLSEAFKVPVVVDNKPGANGGLGTAFAARSPADGYTLLIGAATTNAVNYALYPSLLGYTPASFDFVAGIGTSPIFLYVPSTSPWLTLAEVIAYGRDNPGAMRCGSGNSVTQVSCEIFFKQRGIDGINVPYKSNPQSLTDLQGGHIDIAFADASVAKPFTDSKRLRVLATTKAERVAKTQAIPPFVELDANDFEITAWTAVFAPKGTPTAVLEQLHAVIANAAQSAEFEQLLVANGSELLPIGLEQGNQFVEDQVKRWADYIQASGLKPE